MTKPDLSELETLAPESGLPDDARVYVSAGDLRALLKLIPAVRGAETLRNSLDTDGQDLTQPVWEALENYDHVRPESEATRETQP